MSISDFPERPFLASERGRPFLFLVAAIGYAGGALAWMVAKLAELTAAWWVGQPNALSATELFAFGFLLFSTLLVVGLATRHPQRHG